MKAEESSRMRNPEQAAVRGQSSVEYAVVCAALAVALGVGMAGDASVLKQLLDSFGIWYQRFSFALSIPI